MWSMELCLLEVPVTSREDMERKPWAEEAEGKGRTTGVSGGVVMRTGLAAARECLGALDPAVRLYRHLLRS